METKRNVDNQLREEGRSVGLRWLVDGREDLPPETRLALVHSLYGDRAIFLGGVLNSMAVSIVIAIRIGGAAFILWAAAEVVLAIVRGLVLRAGRRAVQADKTGPIGLYLALALAWAATVGYGTFITLMSGDWVAAVLACMSGAGVVGGICLRNFAAPRLVVAMIVLSFGPCAAAALLSGQTILFLVAVQVPLYLVCMTMAAVYLNKMMVRTMLSERENDRRARHDPLTGLLNRAGLGREIAARTARDEPFSLFYLDLDGFKTVNDHLGHQAGDELLKAVAERLQSMAGDGAAIARIGGDEFVIVADGADAQAAQQFGDEIVRRVADSKYRIPGDIAAIGVSAGVAFYPEHGADLGNLLAEADAALYQAKFWGRARCMVAGAPAPTVSAPLAYYGTLQQHFERDAA